MSEKRSSRITVKDIAKIVGVSATAVSMALNNRGALTDSRREEIKRVAAELGYVPNAGARSLRGSHTRSFGVVINYFNNPFFHDFFMGLEDVTNKIDFSYWVSQTWDDLEQEQKQVRKLAQLGVDGLIVLPCSKEISHLTEMTSRFNIPLVLISHSLEQHFPAVVADNIVGARMATEHLLSLKDRPVLHIAGPVQAKSGIQERYQGYCQAMAAADPEFDAQRSVFYVERLRAEDGYEIMSEILKYYSLPLSLFVVNDETALGVLNYCHNNNLRVPEDISVVGFSDIDLLESLNISLSTVAIPRREMGQYAAHKLLSKIDLPHQNKHNLGDNEIITTLPVSLIIRDSSRIR
ncbi:LacI family DNA-binding transcriptional regulator [Limnobaculum xujianqingii]|uniref:LacI family DNA-binding transcriptional regulator n=1 Tax=Limnobaculum xujianqingii TaxID=2738837 RepID=UPI0011289228|nr:LacI family DNA-binding transcriptional regulator [Limnobaculum xujianqingii]